MAKLPYIVTYKFIPNNNNNVEMVRCDAIHIEWIEEWIETSKEKIDVAHYMLSIYQMMRDWREENGNL